MSASICVFIISRSGRTTFGAVAFTSYGAFWLSFWAFVQFFEKSVPKADAGHAVGLFLIAWGIFTAYMFIASLRTTAAIALVEVGPVVLSCDGDRHELEAGDAVTFDADLPHHFENPGTQDAVLLAVVSAGLRRS